MTHIEQLIQDMCPEGVEFKKLGELGVFENTGVDKKSRDDEQEVTLLNFMDVCRHKYIDASIPSMVVTAPDRKIEQCNVLKDDIFITPSSETIDEIGFAAVIMEDLPNVVYSYHIMRYRLNNPNTTTAKFIRYLFEAPIIRKQILKSAKGLTRFGLSKYQFADLEIPVPPLEIQKKIVECLDKFSALAAELQAELQKRRTQYEYYRTRLLTPPPTESNSADNTDDAKWEWKTLDEIAENCDYMRRPITATRREKGEIPYYGASGIVDYVKDYIYDGEYLLISEDGANLIARSTPIAFSIEGKNWVNNHAHVLKFENRCTQKLVEYYINSINIEPYVSGGAQPKLNQANLNKIPIPVPSLDEQARIVSILDKFEALTNSLSDGIPAEQAAQQKRYEYYRDLLLTFDRKAV